MDDDLGAAPESFGAGSKDLSVVIIGGGPAGLTAAYELSKHGARSTILEAEEVVGGLARTEEYNGYFFDIGGHRFFTKVRLISDLWHEVLGKDFVACSRQSRIFYNSKFFKYPLEPIDALANLGPFEALRCVASWGKAVLFPRVPEPDLATFVINRFGRRLFEIFFKSYTEKVWGMRCEEIGSEWAAQRIRGMSFRSVALHALGVKRAGAKGQAIKSLIHQFEYPRRGPGMMWNRMRDLIETRNGQVVFQAAVTRIAWEEGRVTAVEAGTKRLEGDYFLSSMPIRDLIQAFDPKVEGLEQFADCFTYRDFLTVALIVRRRDLFPDNWIYVHEPGVKVGRIQNFKNWSSEMVPDAETTCVGLEYFCFEGDGLWTMDDDDLVRLGRSEIVALGLARQDEIVDGHVIRARKAYPIYNDSYRSGLAALKDFLRRVPNLQLIGRNGMHQYNNQDHSMLTAVLAVRNIMGGHYDLWSVNVDGDYHEEGQEIREDDLRQFETIQPSVPGPINYAR